MEKTVLIVETKQSKTKKQLQAAIRRKRSVFLKMEKKVETLEQELSAIEEEYKTRVGRLYQEDTLLDVAIIRRRKINELIELGTTAEEAEEIVRESMEQETERVEKQRIETFIHFFDNAEEDPVNGEGSVKELWKKLVRQFHPDLTKDTKEKKEREEVIKAINTAYKENDLEALKTIQEKGIINKTETTEESTVQELELLLVSVENAVIRIKEVYKELVKSEWYGFFKLTKKATELLVSDMEQKLQDDISRKQTILTNLMRAAAQ